jgi:TolA-binding protein
LPVKNLNNLWNNQPAVETFEESTPQNNLLKKYQDEIKVLSTSRKDRLSKLEKKLESLSGFVEVERNVRMSQYKTTTNNIKNLKQACQFAAQALADRNQTQQVELLLAPVGIAGSNFSSKPTPLKPQIVTELTLFN